MKKNLNMIIAASLLFVGTIELMGMKEEHINEQAVGGDPKIINHEDTTPPDYIKQNQSENAIETNPIENNYVVVDNQKTNSLNFNTESAGDQQSTGSLDINKQEAPAQNAQKTNSLDFNTEVETSNAQDQSISDTSAQSESKFKSPNEAKEQLPISYSDDAGTNPYIKNIIDNNNGDNDEIEKQLTNLIMKTNNSPYISDIKGLKNISPSLRNLVESKYSILHSGIAPDRPVSRYSNVNIENIKKEIDKNIKEAQKLIPDNSENIAQLYNDAIKNFQAKKQELDYQMRMTEQNDNRNLNFSRISYDTTTKIKYLESTKKINQEYNKRNNISESISKENMEYLDNTIAKLKEQEAAAKEERFQANIKITLDKLAATPKSMSDVFTSIKKSISDLFVGKPKTPQSANIKNQIDQNLNVLENQAESAPASAWKTPEFVTGIKNSVMRIYNSAVEAIYGKQEVKNETEYKLTFDDNGEGYSVPTEAQRNSIVALNESASKEDKNAILNGYVTNPIFKDKGAIIRMEWKSPLSWVELDENNKIVYTLEQYRTERAAKQQITPVINEPMIGDVRSVQQINTSQPTSKPVAPANIDNPAFGTFNQSNGQEAIV